MRYLLYLLGCFALAILGTVAEFSFGSVTIAPYRLLGLFDLPTLVYLLAACALVLFATRSLQAFGRALLSMFRSAPLTGGQCREGLSAVKGVAAASLLAGGVGVCANIVGMLWSLDGADLSGLGIPINVACLNLCYPLFLCLLLLPVWVSLERRSRVQARETREGKGRQTALLRPIDQHKAG